MYKLKILLIKFQSKIEFGEDLLNKLESKIQFWEDLFNKLESKIEFWEDLFNKLESKIQFWEDLLNKLESNFEFFGISDCMILKVDIITFLFGFFLTAWFMFTISDTNRKLHNLESRKRLKDRAKKITKDRLEYLDRKSEELNELLKQREKDYENQKQEIRLRDCRHQWELKQEEAAVIIKKRDELRAKLRAEKELIKALRREASELKVEKKQKHESIHWW